MPPGQSVLTRRHFFGTAAMAAAAGFLFPADMFAEQLLKTPFQTEGPFYPTRLPLDTDNDLLIVNNAITPAVGAVTHLRGRILDTHGTPIRNAVVEIWQVDNNGIYLHPESDTDGRRDRNFQGFGRFETGSTGEYYFRTIKPVPYSPRTAHIHFAVKTKGRDVFTTQCYVRGEPQNRGDFVLEAIRDARARERLIVDFAPVRASKIGELAAKFDIVLGSTPEG